MYDKRGWEVGSAQSKRHNLLASDSHLDNRLAEIKKLAPTQSLKDVPIYITEWNTHISSTCTSQLSCSDVNFWPSTLLQALHVINWAGSGMYNDDLGGLAYWLLAKRKGELNSKGGGFTLLASRSQSTEVYKNSPFYAFKMLGMMHNTVVARTNPTNVNWKPWADEWEGDPYASSYWTVEDVPYVTVAATVSDDHKELAVLLLNKNTIDGYNVNLNIGSFPPDEVYTKYVLNSTVLDEGHNDIYDRNLYSSTADGGIEEQTEVEVIDTIYTRGAAKNMIVQIPSHSATLLKFTQSGTVGIIDPLSPVPDNHSLSQNYPNPFNPSTTINYTMQKSGSVNLKIFDLYGSEIETLVDAYQLPNTYTIKFSANRFASGIYYIQLQIDNVLIETKKMVLLR